MIDPDDPELLKLVQDWHEATRPIFKMFFKTCDYDEDEAKTIDCQRRYIYLRRGTRDCERFLVDRKSGDIYHNAPGKQNHIGVLGRVTGAQMHNHSNLAVYGKTDPRPRVRINACKLVFVCCDSIDNRCHYARRDDGSSCAWRGKGDAAPCTNLEAIYAAAQVCMAECEGVFDFQNEMSMER